MKARSTSVLGPLRTRTQRDENGCDLKAPRTSFPSRLRRGRETPAKTPPSSRPPNPARRAAPRSEEHTSELQSHLNLVCRLLLEKKKKTDTDPTTLANKKETDS